MLALGQTFTNPNNGTKATAFQVIRPAAVEAPAPEAPNTEWAAVDVQVCLGTNLPDGTFVTGESWKLRDANNGQFGRSSTGYSQFPAPEFPYQQPVGGGECFRGWIVFPVVVGVKLTAVVYSPGQTLQPPFPTWPVP